MPRRANRNTPTRPATVLVFAPCDFRILKHNEPGPSGVLGGYQTLENYIIANTDPSTLRCMLDATRLERLIRYCRSYGKGGPNGRLRLACIPALRRAGIELTVNGWIAA